VGVRYYGGYANPGEHVVLKREPTNQYDRNAIRVDNVMGAQVGHIPRNIAAKLAPYMVCCSNTSELSCLLMLRF
jgi:SWI/SNF-related matrix-associated actin-dependent regulator of chromatin subfamily A3